MALKKAQVEVPVESVQESNVANFVLSEFGLREKKKKNVIVFGVPESKSSMVEEHRSDDNKAIQQIFTEIGVKDKGVVSYRRFKKTSDRVPPIFIMTQDVKSQLEMLAAAKKLRNSPSHSRVYLNADMTETERREDRNLREIRKSRPANSTTNNRNKSSTNAPATYISADESEPIESGRVSGHIEAECYNSFYVPVTEQLSPVRLSRHMIPLSSPSIVETLSSLLGF